jgi:hypothetical protein
MLLTRVGMVPDSEIGPTYSEDYKDDVRILCCSQTQRLNPQFMWFIDKMAKNNRAGQLRVRAFPIQIGTYSALGKVFAGRWDVRLSARVSSTTSPSGPLYGFARSEG